MVGNVQARAVGTLWNGSGPIRDRYLFNAEKATFLCTKPTFTNDNDLPIDSSGSPFFDEVTFTPSSTEPVFTFLDETPGAPIDRALGIPVERLGCSLTGSPAFTNDDVLPIDRAVSTPAEKIGLIPSDTTPTFTNDNVLPIDRAVNVPTEQVGASISSPTFTNS